MGRSGRQSSPRVVSRASVGFEPRPPTPLESLLAAFNQLSVPEQEEAFAALHEARLLRIAGEDSEAAIFVRAMREAGKVAGDDLAPDAYKQAREQLRAGGVELPSFAAVVKHFGSWRLAKEALSLSEIEPAERIAARFRARRVGKTHNFNEDALRAALAACSAFLGRPPLVAEYEAWRARELELAHERGDRDFALPSPGTFRKRYKTWTATLVHFGYSPEEIYVRLEPQGSRRDSLKKIDRYTDETLGKVLLRCARDLGHVPLVEEFDAWRTREINRTRSKKFALPSNSPYRRRWGTWEGALLHFGFTQAEIDARRAPAREAALDNLRPHQYSRPLTS